MSVLSEVKTIFSRVRVRMRSRGPDPLGVRSSERATLTGTMDWYRQVAINKLDGLTFEQASKPVTPSGHSILGVVKHLTWAEAGWYRDTFAGEDLDEVDVDESFRIQPDDTIESVVAVYRAESAHANEILAAKGLDDLSKRSTQHRGHVSLRWILVHLIEETARHAGHLDIMREQIDGRTGD